MARDRKPEADLPHRAELGLPGPGGQSADDARQRGTLESIFQEAIRRAASLGFSSFFMTEEALRRAFNEAAPKDWTNFVTQQSDQIRAQIIDRASREFGEWLRTIDMRELLRGLLDEHEFHVSVDISATRKQGASGTSLQVVTRRK